MPDKRMHKRREVDERFFEAINDLLQTVYAESIACTEKRTRDNLTKALAEYALKTGNFKR